MHSTASVYPASISAAPKNSLTKKPAHTAASLRGLTTLSGTTGLVSRSSTQTPSHAAATMPPSSGYDVLTRAVGQRETADGNFKHLSRPGLFA